MQPPKRSIWDQCQEALSPSGILYLRRRESTLKMDNQWGTGRQAHKGTVKSLLIKANILLSSYYVSDTTLRSYSYTTFSFYN